MQDEHDDWLVDAWKNPAVQLVHKTAPALEYVPAAHVPDTTERPALAQYDPDKQLAHEVWPVDAW